MIEEAKLQLDYPEVVRQFHVLAETRFKSTSSAIRPVDLRENRQLWSHERVCGIQADYRRIGKPETTKA